MTNRMLPVLAICLLVVPLATALVPGGGAAGAGLNVWLERRALAHVFDWMQFLTAKNPLRPKCKPSVHSPQHRALTLNEYPLISDGALLSNPKLDSLSRAGIALAHNINSLRISWSDIEPSSMVQSQVRYRFLRLKSHNTTVLREPVLDIPAQGFVPNLKSGFEVTLQCSNRISGITGFEIHVVFDWPQNPTRRLIVLQRYFKKACLSIEDQTKHRRKCHCRSQCVGPRLRRNRQQKQKQQQQQQTVRLRHAAGRERMRRRASQQQKRRCQRRCQKQCRKDPSACEAGLPK